jgi:hypothetical protein
MTKHLSLSELEAGLAAAGASPQDHARLEMIVARPATDQRQVQEQARLTLEDGLVGDVWRTKGAANPGAQITLMNSRVIQTISQDRAAWPLAGDQLFVDLDLSQDNLPPGTRLVIGSAVLEVTAVPHNGCSKFAERYGPDATRFVNTEQGKAQRRRGLNARVVQPGEVRVGDTVSKMV